MSVKTQIKTTPNNQDITLYMQGKMDYENVVPLRVQLQTLTQDHPKSTLILDLELLDFVGSSGISTFVETLNLLHGQGKKWRLTNVRPEFLKVFKLYQLIDGESPLPEFEADTIETGVDKRVFEN